MLLLLREFGRPDVTLCGLTPRAVQVPTNSDTCTVVLHSSYLLLTPVPVSSWFPQLLSSLFLSSFLLVSRVLVSWFLRFLSPGFSSSYHLIFPVPIFRYLRFLFRSLFLGSPSSRLLVSVVHSSRCLQFLSLVFCISWNFRISPVPLSLSPV